MNLETSIGKTSLCRKSYLNSSFFIKLEGENPSGSIKDRLAHHLVSNALKQGNVKPGQKVIEVSTGNTGIALAYVCRELGLKSEIILPEDAPRATIQKISSFGGKTILLPVEEGPLYALNFVKKKSFNDGYFWPNQYQNQDSIVSYFNLGKELIKDFNKHCPLQKPDYFVAGVGTGGTLMGAGKVLKEHYPKIEIIAVESEENDIEGIRNSDVFHFGEKDIYKKDFPSKIMRVSKKQSDIGLEFLLNNGITCSRSSGAVAYAAMQLAEEGKERTFVLVSADGKLK